MGSLGSRYLLDDVADRRGVRHWWFHLGDVRMSDFIISAFWWYVGAAVVFIVGVSIWSDFYD